MARAPGTGAPPTCAVSIDVDPIPCYYRIHGLDAQAAPPELRDVVARCALPRFGELFERRGIAATFFVVAEDIDGAALGRMARATRARYADLVRAGHELGSHSYSHPYDLARWPRARARDEIARAHELLGELAGRVRGFRAPGYDVSPAMLEELVRLGYLYDSSIFPAPGYYAAKAVIMAAMRLAGRSSGAVLTSPRALLAPPSPYRPSVRSPWRRGRAPLVELPVAVTPFVRAPAIGTSLLLAPAWLRRRLVGAMRGRGFFNLELHGIDLVDAEEDGIPGQLVARQPDLRLPLAHKLAALDAVLDQVQGSFQMARLGDLAERWNAEL
ncbi:MAG TPA: polysaccharide deacetylase family protein [Kofleriaceae bacterium]|nr:polysaccharide deacetylase family protein [Kofleriaceae bacterium]